MLRKTTMVLTVAATLTTAVVIANDTAGDLQRGFAQPPASARPWVYWFPLSGNLTKEGMTADLEAMRRAGIGGVLYMEVDQGAPKGPADFAGPLWRELFHHACLEADRLGLELNMNNDAGWCGSGGPWITPELSMQRVVWSETIADGPTRLKTTLAQPPSVRGFYRDIAVLAMPAPAGKTRIASIQGKSSLKVQQFPPQPAHFPSLPPNTVIPRKQIVELSARMQSDGKLTWNVPPGQWLILRLGHTTTGKENHPAAESGRGLECDKFSRAAATTHFNALVGRLAEENRTLTGRGKVFVSTHVDSWEVGSQNWTPRMREEFRTRRGYDLLPLLPVLSGRVVDSLEVSERFLWDFRQTVSDLIVENYAGQLRRLANQHGLRLSIEAYGEPADNMAYAGQADEPMSEFWSWNKFGAAESCTEMASAAHTYGKRILGAEAFTANNAEKWLGWPGNIKDLGDWAFCEGVNRFVFHRYAAQPWTDRAPGMSMGPWGLHYERTQTWWEQSRAWHEYLARCQYLLQQGLFVADVCYLQPEGAPRRFVPPPAASVAPHVRGGYNFDGCTPQVVLSRMRVCDGRIVLPDGMSYRVLVLPQAETMTPALLAKIRDLVRAGATVFAPSRPQKSPGLSNYPACDEKVRQLADEIWGDGPPPAKVTERCVGEGRVIWGGLLAPESAAESDVPTGLGTARWIWRKEGKPATAVPPGIRYFRRVVTLDRDVRVESARLVMTADNAFKCWINGHRVGEGNRYHQAYVMDVASALKPGANVVAVAATNGADAANPAGLIGLLTIRLHNGRVVRLPTDQSWEAAEKITGQWRTTTAQRGWDAAMELGPSDMAPWGQPEITPEVRNIFPDATVIHQWLGNHGVPADFSAARPLRYIHRRMDDADVYFVANGTADTFTATCRFRVTGREPELWHPETGRMARVPCYEERDGCTQVLLRFGPAESFFVVFRRPAQAATRLVSVRRNGRELLRPDTAAASEKRVLDLVRGEIWQPGTYEFKAADGGSREITVAGPFDPVMIGGPWEVRFDPRWGGPGKVTFEKLEDWSKRPERGIRYYSGTAVYRKTIHLDPEILAAPSGQGSPLATNRRLYLDLGRVAVMAQVKLNGKDLGILWKPPYRVDITKAAKAGKNGLELKVVNLWINRQIGDEQLAEDSDRNPNGTLRSWPEWLEKGQPSPTGRFTFTSWRLWKKNDPLQPSGLLGPVMVQPAARLSQ